MKNIFSKIMDAFDFGKTKVLESFGSNFRIIERQQSERYSIELQKLTYYEGIGGGSWEFTVNHGYVYRTIIIIDDYGDEAEDSLETIVRSVHPADSKNKVVEYITPSIRIIARTMNLSNTESFVLQSIDQQGFFVDLGRIDRYEEQ